LEGLYRIHVLGLFLLGQEWSLPCLEIRNEAGKEGEREDIGREQRGIRTYYES
jgi:hypothetical protein